MEEIRNIRSKDFTLFGEKKEAKCLFIEALEKGNPSEGEEHYMALMSNVSLPFVYVCFYVKNWNDELSPYEAPPIFGKAGFGGKGKETFDFLQNELLPYLRLRFSDIPIYLGGYSLAALFALYAGTLSDEFAGIAAASPSLWYTGYLDYAKSHPLRAKKVSLSLGDKEHLTKNKVLATVKENMLRYEELLKTQGVSVTFSWNEGNHFVDVPYRIARAFAALI